MTEIAAPARQQKAIADFIEAMPGWGKGKERAMRIEAGIIDVLAAGVPVQTFAKALKAQGIRGVPEKKIARLADTMDGVLSLLQVFQDLHEGPKAGSRLSRVTHAFMRRGESACHFFLAIAFRQHPGLIPYAERKLAELDPAVGEKIIDKMGEYGLRLSMPLQASPGDASMAVVPVEEVLPPLQKPFVSEPVAAHAPARAGFIEHLLSFKTAEGKIRWGKAALVGAVPLGAMAILAAVGHAGFGPHTDRARADAPQNGKSIA